MSADIGSIRRFAGWALVGGLSFAAAPRSVSGNVDRGTAFLATTVIEIAERIELLNTDPGNREPRFGRS